MASEAELMQIRFEKEDKIKEYGIKNRPERYERTSDIEGIRALEDGTKDISVAGRILSKRKMGKISFIHIGDITGKVQLVIKREDLGEEEYRKFHEITDIGDFIGVKGDIFTTQAGEKSVQVYGYTFLGKSYRPLPEKFHGLVDQELIYRERHLDLIMNDDAKKRFLLRSKFIKLLREFLDNNNFIEVDTPILQNTASGATAKPFIAHHNAYDIDVFLRIAPELTLKKLIIGGFNNVYEVARNFRNEGIDRNHLQDFTSVEGYSAYWNYEDNMKFLREMVIYIFDKLFDGNLTIKIGDNEINFGEEWDIVSFRDIILKDCGIDIDKYETAKDLLAEIRAKGIELDEENVENLGRGNLIDALYKKVSRPTMIKPTYLIKHPIDLSPLARANDDNKKITDRFQLVVNGQEIINGYSELVDAKEQELRLIEQSKLKANGDEEAMSIDEEYIKAMEYGMPPISGWGLGIDRFLQFLTNCDNIRDVVLYPLMRPRD
ncbi:MAG: lysine--tRNA ligase [Clostridia bacterium]|nr:lysine--tRNA ligase [Clostridia bacterium]